MSVNVMIQIMKYISKYYCTNDLNIILLLFFNMIISSCYSLKVYQSQLPIESTSGVSGLKYRSNENATTNIKFTNDLTICSRFKYKKLGINAKLFDFKGLDSEYFLWFWIGYPLTWTGFGNEEKGIEPGYFSNWIMKDPKTNQFNIWYADHWHHLCIRYAKATSSIAIVKDGQVTNIDFVDERLKNVKVPSNFLDIIYVGRCADNSSDCSLHSGDITDVNIWNRALSMEEMIGWTNCSHIIYGDIVDWNTAEWEVSGMEEYKSNYTNVCKPSALGLVLIPGPWNITEATNLCQNFRGQLNVITSEQNNEELMTHLRKSDECKNYGGNVWTGWWDEPKEGQMTSITSSKPFNQSFAPWGTGEPNGDTMENCGILSVWWGGWNDIDCSEKYCAACQIPVTPVFVLRGLCYGSSFDAHYGWTGEYSENTEIYYFRGFSNSLLVYDQQKSEWKLTLYSNPNIYATCNESTYPFGMLNWYFFNDTCQRIGSEQTVAKNVYRLPINFNGCNSNYEYNCLDGTCVDLSSVCNGRLDCPDKSDEIECESIIFDESYLNNVPPTEHGDYDYNRLRQSGPKLSTKKKHEYIQTKLDSTIYLFTGIECSLQYVLDCHLQAKRNIVEGPDGKVKLNVSLTLESILDLDEVKSLMKLQIEIKLSWVDSRLEFVNVDQKEMNTINLKQKEKLWLPSLIFDNTNDKIEASFDDDKSNGIIDIEENARGQIAPLMELKNFKKYTGSQGRVIFSKFFLVGIYCPFDMTYYPFDRQSCQITLVNKGNAGENVQLIEDSIAYLGPESMVMYYIEKPIFVPSENNSIIVKINLGRRLLNVMTSTFLPTIIIVMASFSTNFYSEEHFDAIVTVNLTALLVMVTFFIGITDGLPRTSYLKMVDVWLIFTLSLPFIEVILHTIMDVMRSKISNNEMSKKILMVNGVKINNFIEDNPQQRDGNLEKLKNFTTYGLPLIFVVFSFGYFGIGALLFNQVLIF